MTKNRYTDVTNNSKPLTLLVIVAIIVVVFLILSYGGVSILGGGTEKLDSEQRLVVAQIDATKEVDAAQAAKHAREQAEAEQTMRAESTATSVKVTETARANEVLVTNTAVSFTATAAQDAINTIVSNNATNTAYPPQATETKVRKEAEDAATDAGWVVEQTATKTAIEIEQTATKTAIEQAETKRRSDLMISWVTPILISLCLILCGISVGLIFIIWKRHVAPIVRAEKAAKLTQIIERLDGLDARWKVVVGIIRRIQYLEERIEHAEDQE